MKKIFQGVREWLKVFGLAIILALFFKSCFFDVYTIPSTSMSSTLRSGDVVVVNKLAYGPKINRTILSIPFTHKYIPMTEGVESFSEAINLPYFRFPGYRDIQNGDLIVFHYPMDDLFPIDHRSFYIKRCVAIPGDTLEIRMDSLFINSRYDSGAVGLSYNYMVQSKADLLPYSDSLDISEGGSTSHDGIWQFTLDKDQKAILESDNRVKEVKKVYSLEKIRQENIFAREGDKWNTSFYGPLVVPGAGDTIEINKENISLYERIISVYEGHHLSVSPEGKIYIDKLESDYFVPEMNYYFTMGDNRHNSSDSRFWGFVPEDHIQGKASSVIYSVKPYGENSGSLRWDRFFKSIE